MKRLSVLLAGLLLSLGLVQAQEQNTPLRTGSLISNYSLTKTDGNYRSLSAGATVLTTLPDTLNNQFIMGFKEAGNNASQDSLVPVCFGKKTIMGATFTSTPAKRTSCIALPQKMMFGKTEVAHVGMTTDGFLFFGDTVIPTFVEGDQSITYYMVGQAKSMNFVYFGLNDLTSAGKWVKTTVLRSGPNTRIGYEAEGDMLYIAYENVVLKESETESQLLSWNYQINTATGDIALQTNGFYTGIGKSYPARSFAYGLVGASQNEASWLSNFLEPNNKTSQVVIFNQIDKDSLPAGASFAFKAPENCSVVESPIHWNISTIDAMIALDGTSWDNPDYHAMFVLSETEVPSEENTPKDGVIYKPMYGGSGFGLGTVNAENTRCLLSGYSSNGQYIYGFDPIVNNSPYANNFRGLSAEKEYWIHGYVYNPSCSNGPLYGTVTKQKVKTTMTAPTGNGFSLSDFKTDEITLTLPEPENGKKYIVALSTTSLHNEYNLLKHGQTYQSGDKIADASATIIQSGVGAGSYKIESLSANTVYFVSVWVCKGEGDAIEYSARYYELAGQTVIVAPATVAFDAYEPTAIPACWLFSENSEFTVQTYSSGNEPGPLSVKAPESGKKVLYSLLYNKDDSNVPTTLKTSAISPIISKGDIDKISAIFSLGFYNYINGSVSTLRTGDSVIISYAESQDAQTWTSIGTVTKDTKIGMDGWLSFPTSGFVPNGNFYLKIECVLRVPSADERYSYGLAIENIVLQEDLPCKYPTGLTVPIDEIGTNSAMVTWEDGNVSGTESFIVKYHAETDEEDNWMQDTVTAERILLTNLNHSTLYTVKVQAFCGEETGLSLERETSFTTALGFPYHYDPNMESNVPEGSSQYRGLPGKDLTAINLSSSDNIPQWTVGQDAAQSTVLVNYLDQNPDAWLMFPPLNADKEGTIRLDMKVSAWGFGSSYNYIEAQKTSDSLWIFVSSTGNFKTDRQLVGFVEIDSLHYKMDGENALYDSVSFEFGVEEEKAYTIALYAHAPNADMMSFDELTILAVRDLNMKYSSIVHPAVTNLSTSNLKKDSVTISWQGQADEYRLLYKEHAAEKEYDTVKTEQTSYTLSGLKPNTRYAYRVYGIYGGEIGKLSEERSFTTLSDGSGEDPENDTVATPVFDTPEGPVTEGKMVKITCATEGARIYFTTDGSTPTDSSAVYVFGVSISRDMTIKAVAVKKGMVNSKIAEATYTIDASNEDDLLAEVKLYPNPTDGLFYVTVPEAAKVEIYTSNGTLVKQLNVAAGQTTLQLNQAGMYFVKVNINGQFAIRKIVVR